MALEYAILGFLAERPRSGYDLKTRCFDDTARGFWTADQAQVYRTLDRLQKVRWVSATRKRQAGKPDRKVFEITHSGREALAEWLASPLPVPPPRDPFLVQVFFGATTPNDALIELLGTQRSLHTQRIDALRDISSRIAREPGIAPREEVLKQTVLDGALASERASVEWLDDCMRAIQEGALPGSGEGKGQRQLFGMSPA